MELGILIVLLVSGEVGSMQTTMTQCMSIAERVRDGKELMADIEGESGQHRILWAACREVSIDEKPTS
jgi:hypothetical protein